MLDAENGNAELWSARPPGDVTARVRDGTQDSYLRAVARIPPLSRADEAALAHRLALIEQRRAQIVAGNDLLLRRLPRLRDDLAEGRRRAGELAVTAAAEDVVEDEPAARTRLVQGLGRLAGLIEDTERTRAAVVDAVLALRLRPTAVASLCAELRPEAMGADLGRLADLDRELQEVRMTIVRAHLPLVVGLARRRRSARVPLLDLVQEGNIGLIRALERFDFSRGFRFATYAVWWVRREMSKALAEQGRVVRLPANVIDELQMMARASHDLLLELGREPHADELARRLGWRIEVVRHHQALSRAAVSVQAPIGPDEDDPALEEILTTTTNDVSAEGDGPMLALRTRDALAALNATERAIVSLRYGLDGAPLSLQSVATQLGLSREQVRHTEARALRKLRRMRVLRELAGLDEA